MTDTSTLELSPAPTVSDEPYVSLTVLSDMRLVIEPTQIARGGEHNSALFKIVSQPSSLDPYACRAEVETLEGSTYRLVVDGEFRLTIDMAVTGIGRLQLVYSDGVDLTRKTNIAQFTVTPSINAVDPSDPEFQDGLAELQSRVFAGASITGSILAFQNLGGLDVDQVTLPAGSGGGIDDVPPASGAYARTRTPAGTEWIDFNTLRVASLDNPQFTGTPTAPSPPPGDTSPRLATAQFVAANFLDRAGGAMSGPFVSSFGAEVTNVGLGIGDQSTGFFRVGSTLILSVGGALTMQFFPATGVMMTAPLSMAAQRITALGDATLADDALNRRVADARYLQLAAGGIVTSPVQYYFTPVVPNDAVNKLYVDAAVSGVVAPTALRTIAYTPNEITIVGTATTFLDVNFPIPPTGLRNVLVTVTPIFASNDAPGTSTWQVIYATPLVALESPVLAYKLGSDATGFIRAPAVFTAGVDASSGTIRVLLNARLSGPGNPLTQVGVGGTIAPNMRTIVTVQDLGAA